MALGIDFVDPRSFGTLFITRRTTGTRGFHLLFITLTRAPAPEYITMRLASLSAVRTMKIGRAVMYCGVKTNVCYVNAN